MEDPSNSRFQKNNVGCLSFSQEMLFLRGCASGASSFIARVVRVDGRLDLIAFKEALKAIVFYHEPLRTIWNYVDKIPAATVSDSRDLEKHFTLIVRSATAADLEAAGNLLLRDVLHTISPQDGISMAHGLLRINEAEWYWISCFHHLAADAWSIRLYGQTFTRAYSSSSSILTEEPCTSSIGYAKRQRVWFKTSEAQESFDWWCNKIVQFQPRRVPLSLANPKKLHRAPMRTMLSLGAIRFELQECSTRLRCPLLAILIAALARVLAHRSVEGEEVVLSNFPGRTLPGATNAAGAFYNTLPLQFLVSRNADLTDVIDDVTKVICEASERQEVPMAVVNYACVLEGKVDLTELIPVRLNLTEHPLIAFVLPECLVREVDAQTFDVPRTPRARTSLQMIEADTVPTISLSATLLASDVSLTCDFDSAHYDQDDVDRFLDELASNLHGIIQEVVGGINDMPNATNTIGDWRNNIRNAL